MNQYQLSEQSADIELGRVATCLVGVCNYYLFEDDNKDGLAVMRAHKGIDFCLEELAYNSKTFTIVNVQKYFRTDSCEVNVKIKSIYPRYTGIFARGSR